MPMDGTTTFLLGILASVLGFAAARLLDRFGNVERNTTDGRISIVSINERLKTVESKQREYDTSISNILSRLEKIGTDMVSFMADVRGRLDSIDKDIQRISTDRSREWGAVRDSELLTAAREIAAALKPAGG